MEIKTFRTSTILIASEGRTRLYKSRAEVPPKLRQELQRTLNSSTAATILIADQRGRNEILKLLRGEPSALRSSAGVIRRKVKTESTPLVAPPLPIWLRKRWVRALIAFLVPAAVGAGFYALLMAGR